MCHDRSLRHLRPGLLGILANIDLLKIKYPDYQIDDNRVVKKLV